MNLRVNNVATPILPGKTIGIIGGGQLGRMMALAAKYMGYFTVVLDPIPYCPTAQVADHHVVASYDDMEGIQKLMDLSDVITYEFENVDVEAAKYIEKRGKLPQGTYALDVSQNRKREKELFQQLHLPIPKFQIVSSELAYQEAIQEISLPAVIKTCRGGYDGKGQIKLQSQADHQRAIQFANRHQLSIVEEWISSAQEISVVFTRTTFGDITIFPIAENIHKDHILHQTKVPASINPIVKKMALTAARMIAERMQVVGTFAIEMFVKDDDIYMNEMAPRPHNSGHFTIEACTISQFAQHIRAICHLPLMPVKLLQQAEMINILGEDLEQILHILPTIRNGYVHLYGKSQAKNKRKMGHVTFIANDRDELYTYVKDFKEMMNND